MGGGGGGGGGTAYALISFNMAVLTDFKNTCLEGLYLLSEASFQVLGNVNRGNLLVVARWWAGTYRLFALRRASSGFRFLFWIHVSLKDSGNFL